MLDETKSMKARENVQDLKKLCELLVATCLKPWGLPRPYACDYFFLHISKNKQVFYLYRYFDIHRSPFRILHIYNVLCIIYIDMFIDIFSSVAMLSQEWSKARLLQIQVPKTVFFWKQIPRFWNWEVQVGGGGPRCFDVGLTVVEVHAFAMDWLVNGWFADRQMT